MVKLDLKTTLNALLYIIHLKNQCGDVADKYEMVKLLYLADKEQLHRWGQTITGDRFAALQWGPVGSDTLDMLNAAMGDPKQDQRLGVYLRQFITVDSNPVYYEGKRLYRVTSKVDPDMNWLSPADKEVIDHIVSLHGHYPPKERFDKLVEVTHDQAFRSAQDRRDHWMSYEDLAEEDEDLLDQLSLDAEAAPDLERQEICEW